MTILNIFANQSGQIPLSELDTNFATPITIGTTQIQLGQTTTTLTGVTLSGSNLGTPTGNLANCIFPTLNQNTTGTASNVTSTVAVGNGGTGLTSLTTGYIPYGNGTSAFNSSFKLFFDGTNLGIGTSSPTQKLQVAGSQLLSSPGSAVYTYFDGTSNSIGRKVTGELAITVAGGYPITFVNSTTEAMRIDSSGNVGIGTSSPSIKLNAQGFGVYRGNSYVSASFCANSTLAPLNITQLNNGTIPAISAGQTSGGTWVDLGFLTSDTERMRITSSGGLNLGDYINDPGAGNMILSGLSATSAAPTIASATTIAPTKAITFISGVTPIATITPPSPISLGGGQITLIPTNIFTTTTAGNIALASTAIVSRALIMTYDVTTAKWYPSY